MCVVLSGLASYALSTHAPKDKKRQFVDVAEYDAYVPNLFLCLLSILTLTTSSTLNNIFFHTPAWFTITFYLMFNLSAAENEALLENKNR